MDWNDDPAFRLFLSLLGIPGCGALIWHYVKTKDWFAIPVFVLMGFMYIIIMIESIDMLFFW